MAALKSRTSFAGGLTNRWLGQLPAGDGADGSPVGGRISQYCSGEAGLECLRRLDERADLAGARRVAGGNHGDIILAQDRHAPRALAVKVVSLDRSRRCGDDEAALRKEVHALQELQGHPNLVQLVDVLSCCSHLPGAQGAPPFLCIAMEYIADSEPLAGQIKRGGPQPQLAVAVLPQLAGALEFMHDRGFVHRDLWSENVLIGRGCHAVLVDLGCAERCAPGCRLKVPPKVNLSYASPEATECWGPQPGDDAWALGLLSAEMCAGRFVGDILGRTDIPIHLAPAALKALLSEAASVSGTQLRRVIRGLLAKLKDRFLMKDVSSMLRGEAPGGHKMEWTPPATECPSTPKVHAAQFRGCASFTSTSFADICRPASPGPSHPDMRCHSLSPTRNRAPPPRVEAKPCRSKSLAPSCSFNVSPAAPGSPLQLGTRSMTFGPADLKSALAGFLKPTALSFTMPDFGSFTGSLAVPSRPRAQSPSFADGDAGGLPPPPPPPPARSPASSSRPCALESRRVNQAPAATQQAPSEQQRSREDNHPPAQSFGWSPPAVPSARGQPPAPGAAASPHAAPPHHRGTVRGESARAPPAQSPSKARQATALALPSPPPPPQALPSQPLQLYAHLLPHGTQSGSIAVTIGGAAATQGPKMGAKGSIAAPVLMMCQSFLGGTAGGMTSGGGRHMVQANMQSPMRRVR